jgi:hypothetical protein
MAKHAYLKGNNLLFSSANTTFVSKESTTSDHANE